MDYIDIKIGLHMVTSKTQEYNQHRLKRRNFSFTCDPFWSVAAPNIFSGLVLWAREALTQIIQINNTRRMRKITAPATPPAMYANSLFSPQKSPVNDPAHWQTGLPPFFQSYHNIK